MFKDKAVAVTGAGGSIGSALCERLRKAGAAVIAIARSERALECIPAGCAKYLGDVTDANFMNRVLDGVDIVYHCAAYKHVGACELNPHSARFNNVFGTINTLRAAELNHIRSFVLLSTDKAHEPISVYGHTKLQSERAVRASALFSNMDHKIVRLCNVLDTSGSVLPLWRKQIAAGGPLTLTDPDATRYFMTMYYAENFLMRAPVMSGIGPHVPTEVTLTRMMDLAQQFIVGTDVRIEITGLRPGEKLHETLVVE